MTCFQDLPKLTDSDFLGLQEADSGVHCAQASLDPARPAGYRGRLHLDAQEDVGGQAREVGQLVDDVDERVTVHLAQGRERRRFPRFAPGRQPAHALRLDGPLVKRHRQGSPSALFESMLFFFFFIKTRKAQSAIWRSLFERNPPIPPCSCSWTGLFKFKYTPCGGQAAGRREKNTRTHRESKRKGWGGEKNPEKLTTTCWTLELESNKSKVYLPAKKQ